MKADSKTKVSIRLTGWLPTDITKKPNFMENMKEFVEEVLTKKNVLLQPLVKEVMLGKTEETKN